MLRAGTLWKSASAFATSRTCAQAGRCEKIREKRRKIGLLGAAVEVLKILCGGFYYLR